MSFDEIIDRRGTNCSKWDAMEKNYGVSSEDGLSMWVADMDFRPPRCVNDALQAQLDHGIMGYIANDSSYRTAICDWMQRRHDWTIDPQMIFTTAGLVNGTGLCLDAFTAPGDGVVLMTPVYHAFARVIKAAGRRVIECELANNAGRYEMDFDSWDAQMDGTARMLILCSPHNPGGRVWTRAELDGVADFARRHDLIIVSDEIHHDLVFPGHSHTVMSRIDGVADRLVMMTAPSKTFNLAGPHCGQVIIEDPALRARFANRMAALGMASSSLGLVTTQAAYSADGAAWLDDLITYLDGNRQIFDKAVNAIPGLSSMPLESTYLSWVDFSGTGMDREEFTNRVQNDARIAANHGPTFGKGGENHLRFNIATPRARVIEATKRLAAAFEDLQ